MAILIRFDAWSMTRCLSFEQERVSPAGRCEKGRPARGRPFLGDNRVREGSALGELEATSRLGAAVFLALDDARVAREEAGLLQGRPQLGLEMDKGARDAVAHRTGLAGKAAADHGADHVELAEASGRDEGLVDQHAQDGTREIDLDLAPVHADLAGPSLDPHPGDGVLALAGGISAALRVHALLGSRCWSVARD